MYVVLQFYLDILIKNIRRIANNSKDKLLIEIVIRTNN